MMEREFYAATVEEAADRAALALNADRTDLDLEVLDEGSSGFLGIGARDARIVVRIPDGNADANELNVPSVSDGVEVTPDAAEPAAPTSSEHSETDDSPRQDSAPEDLLLAVDRFMIELLSAMGFDGTVDAYDAGEAIIVEVSSAQTGLLIGQKGETIDSIQYLLNVTMYRERTFVKRIVVDTEGYRRRRVEAIQGMAHRTARRAQREKRSLSLPPMSPSERRVVHVFLKDNPDVSTSSEGQDQDRRVVISPS